MSLIAHAVQPFFYWRIEPVTRSQTQDLLDGLDLNLSGRHVTDLGPGNGASLRVFANNGADTEFVERNVAFYANCRLRGFRGRLADFTKEPIRVPDIAYVRGSIDASTFDGAEALDGWLDGLGGNLHIVCPWLPAEPPEWFTHVLDNRYTRVSVLGYQTPVYPTTWVTPPTRSRTRR